MKVPSQIYQAMLAHAESELPNECVGLLSGQPDGRVMERYPLVNALADPRRFESDPRSMFEAEKRRRAARLEFLAIYHSHPDSPPVPSKLDIERNYSDDVMNLIISLQGEPPIVRGWWLFEGGYEEAKWSISSIG